MLPYVTAGYTYLDFTYLDCHVRGFIKVQSSIIYHNEKYKFNLACATMHAPSVVLAGFTGVLDGAQAVSPLHSRVSALGWRTFNVYRHSLCTACSLWWFWAGRDNMSTGGCMQIKIVGCPMTQLRPSPGFAFWFNIIPFLCNNT